MTENVFGWRCGVKTSAAITCIVHFSL